MSSACCIFCGYLATTAHSSTEINGMGWWTCDKHTDLDYPFQEIFKRKNCRLTHIVDKLEEIKDLLQLEIRDKNA